MCFDYYKVINKWSKIFVMDYDYLFFQELPKGIKSVYVNGKRLSIEEFKKAKSDFLSKRNSKIKSSTVLKKWEYWLSFC